MNKTSKSKRQSLKPSHPWKHFHIPARKTQEQLDAAALYFDSEWSKNTMDKRSRGKRMGI